MLRGASLDAYLASAERHRDQGQHVFDDGFAAIDRIAGVISRFAGGRPVETARAADGREFVPFTVRRLAHGKQIAPHHDYHYPLALYDEISPTLDTRTLISFVFVLRRPEAGGELCVYAVTPDTPNPPKMANGFMWDLDAVERRSNGSNAARNLEPWNVGRAFRRLIVALALHQVRPVDPGRDDIDEHFARPGLGIRAIDETEDLGRAGGGDFYRAQREWIIYLLFVSFASAVSRTIVRLDKSHSVTSNNESPRWFVCSRHETVGAGLSN